MAYIIQEIQTTGESTALLPAIIKVNENEMESTRHSILAAAAVSNVDIHACVVYNEFGDVKHQDYFDHRPEQTNGR